MTEQTPSIPLPRHLEGNLCGRFARMALGLLGTPYAAAVIRDHSGYHATLPTLESIDLTAITRALGKRRTPLFIEDLSLEPVGGVGGEVSALAYQPVIDAHGVYHGYLLALDVAPRQWRLEDLNGLAELAAWAPTQYSSHQVEDAFRRLARAEDTVHRQYDLYNALVQAHSDLGEGYAVIEGRRFQFANEAFCAITGYSVQELTELPSVFELIVPEYLGSVVERYRDATQYGLVAARIELALRHRSGRKVHVDVVAKPIVAGTGVPLLVLVRDITEQKRAEVELLESEEKYRLLFSNELDAISLIDTETGRFIDVNRAWTSLYGYSSDDALGLTPSAISPEPEATRQTIAAIVAVGSCNLELRWHKDRSGRVFPVELYAGTFDWQGRKVLCCVTRDITERYEAQLRHQEYSQSIEAKNRELLRLNHLKDEFLSNVSHELRTPLAAIKAAAWILTSGTMGTLDEKPLEYAGMIESHADRLGRLINDVLDLAKIESGTMTYRKRCCLLDPVVKEAIEGCAHLFAEKGVAVTHAESDPPAEAVIDRDRLIQVLINLLANALKFTRPGGTVTVSTRVEAGGVAVAVADTGIGIPSSQLERIFEKFAQVDGSSTRESGGTGLGLAISRSIVVDGHGGSLTVESEIDRGSTFTVRLPDASTGGVND